MTANEGETLESLAAEYGSDAATLQTLNPGLGNAPPPGTTVKVPIPPEDEPPSPSPAPPTAGSGITLVAASPMLNVADSPVASRLLFSALLPHKRPPTCKGR